ncbi:hypothetical protein [Serratia rubidaea]|uniref:hypothetical protein n=1 Tax=Serratia rubidaea TaxID=61652 RepID=UPI003FA38172
MTITTYTEGVCDDGAAILRDGVPMSVSEILDALNAAAAREAVPVYQMRLLDGSQEQYTWAEVTHEEFNTPLKNPDEWEKRVLFTSPPAPAVPEDSPYPSTVPGGAHLANAWSEGWNACRAAMAAAPEDDSNG